MTISGLYCIISRYNTTLSYEEITEQACSGGADIIQFRAKELTVAEQIEIGKNLRNICAKYNIPLIVNDRIDVALVIFADGIHLGQDDLPLKEAKKIIQLTKSDFIIGISTHSLDEAIKAEEDGADYISFGPIFHSKTKPEIAPKGLSALKEVRSKVRIPIVAIGGIDITNIAQVSSVADAVAVISAIYPADFTEINVKKLKAEFTKK